eukprot:1345897-Amorphochlora_amoeboformis.AAC.1
MTPILYLLYPHGFLIQTSVVAIRKSRSTAGVCWYFKVSNTISESMARSGFGSRPGSASGARAGRKLSTLVLSRSLPRGARPVNVPYWALGSLSCKSRFLPVGSPVSHPVAPATGLLKSPSGSGFLVKVLVRLRRNVLAKDCQKHATRGTVTLAVCAGHTTI